MELPSLNQRRELKEASETRKNCVQKMPNFGIFRLFEGTITFSYEGGGHFRGQPREREPRGGSVMFEHVKP